MFPLMLLIPCVAEIFSPGSKSTLFVAWLKMRRDGEGEDNDDDDVIMMMMMMIVI